MVNYKQQSFDRYEIGGYVTQLKLGVSIVWLKKSSTASTHLTLEDVNQVDYQVPTGKKSKIIYCDAQNAASAGDKIYYSDDADASTNPVDLLLTNTWGTPMKFISASIPSGKYINIFDASNGHNYRLIILEENA